MADKPRSGSSPRHGTPVAARAAAAGPPPAAPLKALEPVKVETVARQCVGTFARMLEQGTASFEVMRARLMALRTISSHSPDGPAVQTALKELGDEEDDGTARFRLASVASPCAKAAADSVNFAMRAKDPPAVSNLRCACAVLLAVAASQAAVEEAGAQQVEDVMDTARDTLEDFMSSIWPLDHEQGPDAFRDWGGAAVALQAESDMWPPRSGSSPRHGTPVAARAAAAGPRPDAPLKALEPVKVPEPRVAAGPITATTTTATTTTAASTPINSAVAPEALPDDVAGPSLSGLSVTGPPGRGGRRSKQPTSAEGQNDGSGEGGSGGADDGGAVSGEADASGEGGGGSDGGGSEGERGSSGGGTAKVKHIHETRAPAQDRYAPVAAALGSLTVGKASEKRVAAGPITASTPTPTPTIPAVAPEALPPDVAGPSESGRSVTGQPGRGGRRSAHPTSAEGQAVAIQSRRSAGAAQEGPGGDDSGGADDGGAVSGEADASGEGGGGSDGGGSEGERGSSGGGTAKVKHIHETRAPADRNAPVAAALGSLTVGKVPAPRVAAGPITTTAATPTPTIPAIAPEALPDDAAGPRQSGRSVTGQPGRGGRRSAHPTSAEGQNDASGKGAGEAVSGGADGRGEDGAADGSGADGGKSADIEEPPNTAPFGPFATSEARTLAQEVFELTGDKGERWLRQGREALRGALKSLDLAAFGVVTLGSGPGLLAQTLLRAPQAVGCRQNRSGATCALDDLKLLKYYLLLLRLVEVLSAVEPDPQAVEEAALARVKEVTEEEAVTAATNAAEKAAAAAAAAELAAATKLAAAKAVEAAKAARPAKGAKAAKGSKAAEAAKAAKEAEAEAEAAAKAATVANRNAATAATVARTKAATAAAAAAGVQLTPLPGPLQRPLELPTLSALEAAVAALVDAAAKLATQPQAKALAAQVAAAAEGVRRKLPSLLAKERDWSVLGLWIPPRSGKSCLVGVWGLVEGASPLVWTLVMAFVALQVTKVKSTAEAKLLEAWLQAARGGAAAAAIAAVGVAGGGGTGRATTAVGKTKGGGRTGGASGSATAAVKTASGSDTGVSLPPSNGAVTQAEQHAARAAGLAALATAVYREALAGGAAGDMVPCLGFLDVLADRARDAAEGAAAGAEAGPAKEARDSSLAVKEFRNKIQEAMVQRQAEEAAAGSAAGAGAV